MVVPKAVTPAEASSIAESGDRVVRLAQEATRTLLHLNRQNHFETPEQVMLATEEAWDPETVSRLGEQLKLAIESPGPVSVASTPADEIVLDGPTFARLLGGAAIGLGRTELAVNLIPPEVFQHEQSRKRNPWLVMATLLAASALLPPILLLRWEAAALRRESHKLEQALAPLQARARRLQDLQAQIATLQRESERLQNLRSCRTSWLKLFAAVQERLAAVEDVWLERWQTIAPEGHVPMKLTIHGYILDRGTTPVSARMKTLIKELRTIPGVGAVEEEGFDLGRPHLVRFELVLVGDAAQPL
jgi:Tfp pilus assembly protein PilN